MMKVCGLVGDRLLVLFRLSLDFLYLSRYRGSVYGVTLTIIDLTIGLRERMTVDKMINLDIPHISQISLTTRGTEHLKTCCKETSDDKETAF